MFDRVPESPYNRHRHASWVVCAASHGECQINTMRCCEPGDWAGRTGVVGERKRCIVSEMLKGVKILEVANWVAAPSACAMLADMGAEVMERTRDEWAPLLDEGGCMWAPVQTLDEVIEDPQVLANDFTTTLEHAEDGEFQLVRIPMKFHRTPAKATELAPELGQHTETVLLDLGYSWDDITRLKDRGAII